MAPTTPRRGGSTPSRLNGSICTSTAGLLVPVTVARPSSTFTRSPSKISIYNDDHDTDKENNNKNMNTTPSRYDAFMSPLKSAMKAYPVMSPLKKGRISFASSLRQCSPNTSFRTTISEKEDEDATNTTMTSATASILDEMMLDGDAPPATDDDRSHSIPTDDDAGVHTEEREQDSIQDTSMASILMPLDSPSSSESPISSHTAAAYTENVTLDSPSQHSQTNLSVPPTSAQETSPPPKHATESQISHISSLHDDSLFIAEEALTTPPLDITSQAANIPLPPSPVKPRIAEDIRPPASQPMIRGDHMTLLAADVPLPPSPVKQTTTAPAQGTPSTTPHQTGTPLIDRTSRAAVIPLPASVAPASRKRVFQPSTPEDEESARTYLHFGEQVLPFAHAESVDSPMKAPSSSLHALPYSRTSTIPSPAKRFKPTTESAAAENEEMDTGLPFANGDIVDSPVKLAVGQDGRKALHMMPFAREAAVPSPAKPQVSARKQRTSEAPVMSPEAPAEAEAETTPEQTEDLEMEKEEEQHTSRITISEAGSPIPANFEGLDEESAIEAPAQDAVTTAALADSPSSFAEENTNDMSSAPSLVSATPPSSKSIVQTNNSQSNNTTRSISNAPNVKKRILARQVVNNDSSQMSLSTSTGSGSDSSLDEDISRSLIRQSKNNVDDSLMLSSVAGGAANTSQPKSLKRKASATSIAEQDAGNSANHEQTAELTRRVTRQRSLTLLRDDPAENVVPGEDLAANTAVAHLASTDPVANKATKGKSQPTKEVVAAEEDDSTTAAIVKPAPRTRRQSTRLASTSSLPQPSSRIARRTVAATKTPVVKPVRKSALKKTADVDESANEAQESEPEEATPVVASRRATSTTQASLETGKDDTQTPSVPVTRRPQRSARPARNVAVDAKPLPSPRRVMSPVKKPLRATRAVNSTSALTTTSVKGKGKATEHPEDTGGQEKAATRTPLRSPSRVLLSPTKTVAGHSNPMRSPGRAMPYQVPRSPKHPSAAPFDWSSVTLQTHSVAAASLPRTLSPERYRKTASKIFGSSSESSLAQSSTSSGPASSAASATGLTAQSSPFKGLAQRMTVSNSPSLLSLSVAPELLVLAPPSPGPTKTDEDKASTGLTSSSASMLKISTSSAPDMRRMSTPGFASPLSAGHPPMSPRRALSAQPAGAIPRQELPSPRRVVPAASRPVPSSAAMGTPVRTASRVIFAQPAKAQAGSTLKPNAATLANDSEKVTTSLASASEEPRRSQRSARPQRAVKPVMKEFQATPVASSSKMATTSTKTEKPAVTAAQLQTLTNQNTSANRKLYNQHKVTVIHKDEDRPRSPTSKIRKIGEDATVASKAESIKEGKTARGALVKATRERQAEASSSAVSGSKRPHFVAAGDEGIFESPVKKSRREEELAHDSRKISKALKWDRDLLKPSEKMYTPPGNGRTASTQPPRRTVCKVGPLFTPVTEHTADGRCPYQQKIPELDAFGNVPECKASLSPIVPRGKVEISKIIYRDDDVEDESD